MVARGMRIGAPVSASVTWNPADKHADVTLSNGDLTMSSSVEDRAVRSNGVATTSQKVYFEIVLDTIAFSCRVGMANSSAGLTERPGDQFPATSWAINANDGKFKCGNSPDNDDNITGALSNGDRLGFAYDRANNLLWVRKNGGSWLGDGGAAGDPAAGTNGIEAHDQIGSKYDMAIASTGATGGDTISALFASTNWVDAAPSGFTELAVP